MNEKFAIIANEWKLDAQQEDGKYFFYTDKMESLLSGEKRFVIGRKGSGKSAISKNILQQSSYKIFTDGLSFKNFPFNMIYHLDNINFSSPNQFITIWKYIIYSCVCKQMLRNQNINGEVSNKLSKIYDASPMDGIDRLIEHWTTKEFSATIMTVGVGISGEKQRQQCSWIDATSILENFILEYIDDATYLVVFDELDEDYRSVDDIEERQLYTNLLVSLFKAVQDIRRKFSPHKKLFPIVFIRQDIFAILRDGDKTKWTDFSIMLDWKINSIKDLINYRLSVVLGDKQNKNSWIRFFKNSPIYIGNRQRRSISIFDYIARSTQLRPRDFIYYIRLCAQQASDENSRLISPQMVQSADDGFSEYLKSEIIDEIHPAMPHIEEVFQILSSVRKQTFAPKEFIFEYNKRKLNFLYDMTAEDALNYLFEFNIIGNVPAIRNQHIFKYMGINSKFNYREMLCVHRGLYKTLQIF